MGQVARAAAVDSFFSERDVVTYITRPLWRVWLRWAGCSEDQEPTEWIGNSTRRVFGSRTVVVESNDYASVSYLEVTK